ncbi:MAG: hypothetical protein ABH952_10400 [Candidatus Omnitrophota bacterium]
MSGELKGKESNLKQEPIVLAFVIKSQMPGKISALKKDRRTAQEEIFVVPDTSTTEEIFVIPDTSAADTYTAEERLRQGRDALSDTGTNTSKYRERMDDRIYPGEQYL